MPRTRRVSTQILPFGDPVSFPGYLDFETAAYRVLTRAHVAA